jgi:hypothetical protein
MARGSYDNGPLATYVKEKDYVIHISHVPTDRTVSFPAFLTSFEDTFSSEWGTESVFGRMDQIYTFQQTSRSISVTIEIPSADQKEAEQNLSNVRELTKFLYPTYQNTYNATTISKAPLVRIKFANLIGTNIDGLGPRGLLGKLNGASVTPNNDAGYFDPGQMLYPKVLTLDLKFDVIHERNPGEWDLVVPKSDSKDDKDKKTQDTETVVEEEQSESPQQSNRRNLRRSLRAVNTFARTLNRQVSKAARGSRDGNDRVRPDKGTVSRPTIPNRPDKSDKPLDPVVIPPPLEPFDELPFPRPTTTNPYRIEDEPEEPLVLDTDPTSGPRPGFTDNIEFRKVQTVDGVIQQAVILGTAPPRGQGGN